MTIHSTMYTSNCQHNNTSESIVYRLFVLIQVSFINSDSIFCTYFTQLKTRQPAINIKNILKSAFTFIRHALSCLQLNIKGIHVYLFDREFHSVGCLVAFLCNTVRRIMSLCMHDLNMPVHLIFIKQTPDKNVLT